MHWSYPLGAAMETSFDEESAGKLDDRPLQQSPRQQHNFSAGGCEELSEGYHTCCGCGKRVDNDEVPYQTFYVCATTSTSKVGMFSMCMHLTLIFYFGLPVGGIVQE